ncbi:MAG: hypothetical protein JRE65_16750 [Deltaproteobacteria bacterium]|nr:hypothetical protein [Deltaproteobacteria bacterium]
MTLSFVQLKPASISSWGYEDDPWKGPGPPLLVGADFSTAAVLSNPECSVR